LEYKAAALEKIAQRARSEMWGAVNSNAIEEEGVAVRRFGPVQATAVCSHAQDRCLNRIQGAAEPGAVEKGSLRAAVAWMRSHEVDYTIPVALSRPGRLKATAWLSRRGFERSAVSIRYVRDTVGLEPAEDSRITVYELGDEEDDGFGLTEVAADVFGLTPATDAMIFPLPRQPGWRCYTASLPKQARAIAACGVMFIDDGIAQLGLDATVDTARGEGLNEALLRRRLVDAANEGCHTVVAELVQSDSEDVAPLRRNLLKLGFKEAHAVQHWTRPGFSLSGDGVSSIGWLPA
jgi:hypothetical protein